MHPPGTVPLRISEENCTYTYQKTSRERGGLGAKTATATAREGNKSKMIGLWKHCKITTAPLKLKTAPHMIIGGDCRPALSLTEDWDPGPNLLTPHPHCLPKMCVLSVAPYLLPTIVQKWRLIKRVSSASSLPNSSQPHPLLPLWKVLRCTCSALLIHDRVTSEKRIKILLQRAEIILLWKSENCGHKKYFWNVILLY